MRSGGNFVPGTSSPSLIAVPSRSTVSSKVVGDRIGLKTASRAASRSIGQSYTAIASGRVSRVAA